MSDWRPVCGPAQLRLRARLLADVRRFFAEREVMEVETPLLGAACGTDPNLAVFATRFSAPPLCRELFLQTSPEFAMKRLLAAGSGSIYQICKAFRNSESGRWHNPEFTILEWYRIGFDLSALIEECLALLSALLAPVYSGLTEERVAYRDLFIRHAGLDPLAFDLPVFRARADALGLSEAYTLCGENPVLWLDLLFSVCVQPAMRPNCLYAVYHYPSSQSSLARVCTADERLAERFELFFNGLELGNGFFELADASEQELRFERELAYRRENGLPDAVKDRRLLSALAAGLPDCSGVAVGIDRLLMLLAEAEHIDQVLAFPLRLA